MVSQGISGLEIFNNLNIKGTKRWRKEPPKKCPYCSAENSVYGIEVIAAYTGTLYWECDKCGEKMLRFTKQTTVKHLHKTTELHINLEGLENIWEHQQPN